jgi:hypothetical protein
MSEYRYTVDEHDGTITRGRVYCLRDLGYDMSDNWQSYWDGDSIVAFTVYWRGYPELNGLGGANTDNERAMEAWRKAREYGADESDALNRLARRITGNWDSTFIKVSLERDYDLYALSWAGDPDNEWRDEIEAVNYGEIYRMETAAYNEAYPDNWEPQDDWCEEWYGEAKADEALERAFGLTEFPAELLIEERAS